MACLARGHLRWSSVEPGSVSLLSAILNLVKAVVPVGGMQKETSVSPVCGENGDLATGPESLVMI